MLNQEDKIYLNNLFQSQDWYHSIDIVNYGKIVFYVNYLNLEILNKVPLKYNGVDVLIHFSNSLCEKNKFNNDCILDNLDSELFNLKLVCGESNLIDMFFEIQDADDSITNFSLKFPLEYEKLNSLIDSYGYCTVCDALEVGSSYD